MKIPKTDYHFYEFSNMYTVKFHGNGINVIAALTYQQCASQKYQNISKRTATAGRVSSAELALVLPSGPENSPDYFRPFSSLAVFSL